MRKVDKQGVWEGGGKGDLSHDGRVVPPLPPLPPLRRGGTSPMAGASCISLKTMFPSITPPRSNTAVECSKTQLPPKSSTRSTVSISEVLGSGAGSE